jgi:hypothetical protein
MGHAPFAAELLGLAPTTQHVHHVGKTSKYQVDGSDMKGCGFCGFDCAR